MGTQVDPAVLLAAAATSERLSAEVARQSDLSEADTVQAAAGVPGFGVGAALGRLLPGWGDALARHQSYLATIGTSLSDCAVEYLRSDEASAANFRALGVF